MEMIKQPIKIKSIELANRIVMPPMATSKADDGYVTQQLLEYYDEKSKGGHIGLIFTEHLYTSIEGKADSRQISISRDSDIEGLQHIAEIIHRNGSKVIAQISHAGSAASCKVTGCKSISASAVMNTCSTSRTKSAALEMSHDDIARVVACFADAAARVKKAGFDGVEIHSAHGYLLNQFYSPLSNMRTDEYGGCILNRIRIHIEIIHAIRKQVGNDFIIALRLGASDYMDKGSTIEDGVIAAKQFESAGVDLLDVSGGFCGTMRKDNKEPGYFKDASTAIKREVSVPVILTGGITNKESANELLEEGAANLIGVGRAILRDSDWARNAMQ